MTKIFQVRKDFPDNRKSVIKNIKANTAPVAIMMALNIIGISIAWDNRNDRAVTYGNDNTTISARPIIWEIS